MFDALKKKKPNHFAVRQYANFKLAAGKTLKSILVSCGARLAPDVYKRQVRGLSSITPDGVDGVLTALKELERLGYLERNQQRCV